MREGGGGRNRGILRYYKVVIACTTSRDTEYMPNMLAYCALRSAS